MSTPAVPFGSVRAPRAMVATADVLATQAGLAMIVLGGNAVDAAIAANAVLAVADPHLCGMGGDLFALVFDRAQVHALDASGRAGSGTTAADLRAQGHEVVPFRHHISAVTVPGCVDGWVTLHARFGNLSLGEVLAPAIRLAADGFPASPLLVGSLALLDARGRDQLHELVTQARRPGDRVRRPGVARALESVVAEGRAGFYEGEFGEGLVRLGAGHFSPADLATSQASWVSPLAAEVHGHRWWTMPPASQGYLTLGALSLAETLDLPADPDDDRWAHLLVEAATAAGRDRPEVLHDRADGEALLRSVAARSGEIDPERTSRRRAPGGSGDTTYLCAVDGDGMGVSLIQSNASGFGSWLVEPATGINLHNRAMGFSLQAGHPAELTPGRRPPHTLCPMLVTRADGSLAAVLGTMGGDAQPQVLLQIAVRLWRHRQTPAQAIAAGRWALRGPATGFDTWTAPAGPVVQVEGHASSQWLTGLRARGHRVEAAPPFDSGFGHAHLIEVRDDGMRVGAADPRARIGSCAGL